MDDVTARAAEAAPPATLIPDGTTQSFTLTGPDTYEPLVQGVVEGRWFWFDRGAGLVVKGLDGSGTELMYSGHRRGPVDQSAFEVP